MIFDTTWSEKLRVITLSLSFSGTSPNNFNLYFSANNLPKHQCFDYHKNLNENFHKIFNLLYIYKSIYK